MEKRNGSRYFIIFPCASSHRISHKSRPRLPWIAYFNRSSAKVTSNHGPQDKGGYEFSSRGSKEDKKDLSHTIGLAQTAGVSRI